MKKTNKTKYHTKANKGKHTASKIAKKHPADLAAADGRRSFQSGDVNSKRIFQNQVLCAQFLRNYSSLPQLQNVQPEDIEKVSLRYHIFDEVEINSDTVVRIRKNPETDEPPIYIVPLIDHKSKVDYNVAIQLLTYMVCIWKDWEKEMKNKYGRNCHSKDFRYPFVLPLVYYEGKGKWTADLNLRSRIADMGDGLEKYIPDFAYHVVRIQDYTNQSLLEKGDGMSLLMLLNKVQEAEDFQELYHINSDRVDSILAETPQSAVDIIAGITKGLCRRLNVPEEEADAYVSKIRSEKKMGYLFENMEKMDIQWERQQRAEAQKKLKEALEQLETATAAAKADKEAIEAAARADKEAIEAAARADKEAIEAAARADIEAIKAAANADIEAIKADAQSVKQQMTADYIELLQKFLPDREAAKQHIMEKYTLEEADAEKMLALYWKS